MDLTSFLTNFQAGKVTLIITVRAQTVLFEFQVEGMETRHKLCLVYTREGSKLPESITGMMPEISEQFPQFQFSVVVVDRTKRTIKRR